MARDRPGAAQRTAGRALRAGDLGSGRGNGNRGRRGGLARSEARDECSVLNAADCVFLLDVDNTLVDNDRFGADLGARLAQSFGVDGRDRYWAIYAELREELSFVDYLAALNRFRAGLDDAPELLQMSSFILDYPFADLLYPRAL